VTRKLRGQIGAQLFTAIPITANSYFSITPAFCIVACSCCEYSRVRNGDHRRHSTLFSCCQPEPKVFRAKCMSGNAALGLIAKLDTLPHGNGWLNCKAIGTLATRFLLILVRYYVYFSPGRTILSDADGKVNRFRTTTTKGTRAQSRLLPGVTSLAASAA